MLIDEDDRDEPVSPRRSTVNYLVTTVSYCQMTAKTWFILIKGYKKLLFQNFRFLKDSLLGLCNRSHESFVVNPLFILIFHLI